MLYCVLVSWSWYLCRRGHTPWERQEEVSPSSVRFTAFDGRLVTWPVSARVARGVACPDAARLLMSARPISASPTSVGSRRRLRSATTLDLLAIATNFHALSGRQCLSCCHTSCLEQPAGGGAVVHIVPAVMTSSQAWALPAPSWALRTPRDYCQTVMWPCSFYDFMSC